MSRIGTKSSEEERKELIQETVKQTTENFKKILEESRIEKKPGKVSQILANAGKSSQSTDDPEKEKQKEIEDERKKMRTEFDKEKEDLNKKIEDSEVLCPTCSGSKKEKDHKHILKKTKEGTLKCDGENCETEYFLVPTDPDYKCTKCGLPHKRPEKEDEDTECPLCHNKEFLEFDWKKIKERKTKK